MIFKYNPVKNKVYKNFDEGIRVSNTIKSYGGLDLYHLLVNKNILSIDKLEFSTLPAKYFHDYFGSEDEEIFSKGTMTLMGSIETELNLMISDLNMNNFSK